MKIEVIDKQGKVRVKSFAGIKQTMPNVMKLLHAARKRDLSACVQMNNNWYTLDGVKVVKLPY